MYEIFLVDETGIEPATLPVGTGTLSRACDVEMGGIETTMGHSAKLFTGS